MPENQNDRQGEGSQSFFARQQLMNSARSAFQLLAAVLRNSALYPASHPFVLASAEKFLAKFEELMKDRNDVPFYLVGGELFFEKDSVSIDQSFGVIMEMFTGRDIGGVVFGPGLTKEEIISFAALMNKEVAAFNADGGVDELLAKARITHIVLHRILIVDKHVGNSNKEGKKKAAQVFMDAIETMKEVIESLHLDKKINMRKMNTTVQTMVDNILENRDNYIGLTNLKMYDEYTFAHSVNTSLLASSLGTFLNFDKPKVAALGVAGLLHDMGKASVPHEIVNKPDMLTDGEWEVLKRHPVEGALALADITRVTKMAMVAAFEHHQHGEHGYPAGDGGRPHLFSQIVSIADAYDAITASRVYYRIQTPPDQGIRILLKMSGTSFSSVLTKAFVNMMGLFPVGTVLKLDTGEVALVMHQTRDLMRPRVLPLTKFDGSEKDDADVSLLETAGGKFKRSIVGTIDPFVSHIDLKKYLT